jgi:ABC-type transporter Mla MlaB component
MIEISPCTAENMQNVRLAGNLDVRNANGLQVALNEVLSQGKSGTIDCSALESIDTACIQLLLAAQSDTRGSLKVGFEPSSDAAKWFTYAGVADRLLNATSATSAGTQAGGSPL